MSRDLTRRVGEGAAAEVTGHLLLDPRGAAVSLGPVALQRPLRQLLRTLGTLLLALLGHGAALHVC